MDKILVFSVTEKLFETKILSQARFLFLKKRCRRQDFFGEKTAP